MPSVPQMSARGREVGAGELLEQLVEGTVGAPRLERERVDQLVQVVGRDVRRHPDRDARRAVREEVRQAGRQHRRLLGVAVEVRHEVDRLAVDVAQHLLGDGREPGLGVAVGRRRVAVDRAEVPLPVDQRVAEREVLDHAHQGVVDRLVAVRVVVLDHLADDAGGLRVGPRREQALVVHRVEDAAVDRLQAVAHVGERAAHDDRHRVVEERAADLVLDVHRDGARREPAGAAARVGGGGRLRRQRRVGFFRHRGSARRGRSAR